MSHNTGTVKRTGEVLPYVAGKKQDYGVQRAAPNSLARCIPSGLVLPSV